MNGKRQDETENNNRLLTEQEVSDLIRRAAQTLRNDRYQRRGIPYLKLGRSVRYRLSDVLDFIEDHRIDPEAA